MDVEIRPATPEDCEALTEIAHAAKRHWGYPERTIEAWRQELTFTPEFVAAHPVFAACRAGIPVGCGALAVGGATASVEHLWVRPDEIGGGLGRRLFERLVAEARSRGASELEIVSDPHATGFYQRLGARRTGDHVGELEGRPRVLPVFIFDLG